VLGLQPDSGKNPRVNSGCYMRKMAKILFFVLLALFILAYIFRQLSWK
jgi:hypothetical protein